ncbi:MAG: 16S rRNA (cytidine(1402)-2'-O)-methyltransferase [Flavobacteriales bacterium]
MPQLILVPTPVGNLADITFRAIEVLKNADLILAEDTRKTGFLLKHYGIETKMVPYHQHNEHKLLEKIVRTVAENEITALVTDAGTPGISDPGFLLSRACIAGGMQVSCLPGATAFVPALVMSGLPCDKFIFLGFLPQKKGRQTKLKEFAQLAYTMVFYESPHRIGKTLLQMAEFFGEERKAAVVKEISKIYENVQRGTLKELSVHFQDANSKGEFVIVVEGNKIEETNEDE